MVLCKQLCDFVPLTMLTSSQLANARATYTSMVITGTSLTEAEAMEIAEKFYASDEPERLAALRTHPDMSYEEFVAEFHRVGLLKAPTTHKPSSTES